MKIVFGYDIVTYNGVLPNCLDPKFIPTIYEASKFDYFKCRDYFINKYNCDLSVFNSGDMNTLSEKKSVYDIVNDRKNGLKYKWFYIIEPHSGLDLFFGNHRVHDTFLLNYMSDKAIDEIVNGEGNLLINYTIDGGLNVNLKNFQRIIDFTRSKNIPDEKVYLIFADFKLKRNFEKLGVGYNVHDFNFYLIFKSHEFNHILNKNPHKTELVNSSIATIEDFNNSIGNLRKDFLLLTRHPKLHRYLLISQLHKLGLDNNLISWDKGHFRGDIALKMLKYDNNPEIVDLMENTNRIVDVEDVANVSGYGFEDKKMYLETYISIVTESIFFQSDFSEDKLSDFPTGWVSEKIWKPVGHCQPFIFVGPSKSLKYIRDRFGFKTFHPYIDESYDDENVDIERLRLIQNEIDKFSKKTKEEKDLFLKDVSEICAYNQTKFLEYGNPNIEPKDVEEFNMILNFLS
jgi:hypothetical protein